MKRTALATALVLGIAGCGGGGGGAGSGTTSTGTPPPVAQQLAGYIGTWTGGCDFHALDTVTVTRTPGTNDSIDIAIKTDYFSSTDCTGTILATETMSANITAKYVATVDSSVVFPPSTTGILSKVDQVTASAPARTSNFTGPGVVHTVQNGKAQWCINFGGGNSTCVNDDGPQPAASGIAGGLLLQGTSMYELSPNGNVYTVNSQFTRKAG